MGYTDLRDTSCRHKKYRQDVSGHMANSVACCGLVAISQSWCGWSKLLVFHRVSKPIHLTRIRCFGWVRASWIINEFEKKHCFLLLLHVLRISVLTDKVECLVRTVLPSRNAYLLQCAIVEKTGLRNSCRSIVTKKNVCVYAVSFQSL